MTAPPLSPAGLLLEVCVQAPTPQRSQSISALTSGDPGWAELLWLAVEHKAECLIADALTRPPFAEALPDRLDRLLTRLLRANQHAVAVYRAEAAHLMTLLGVSGIRAMATGGIAVESTLYDGRGGRQFSDLDLVICPPDLTALARLLTRRGYLPGRPGGRPTAHIWHRASEDALVPFVVIDLHTTFTGKPEEDAEMLEQALAPRTTQTIPGHPEALLPVPPPELLLRHARALAEQDARVRRPISLRLRADIARLEIQA
ncbi:MAG: nucleotidyltransferase family protein [Chloroflexi bacterium]|nr:MAG: nucleotidyltransferase family protein [Chloroflexota bacterium]